MEITRNARNTFITDLMRGSRIVSVYVFIFMLTLPAAQSIKTVKVVKPGIILTWEEEVN